MTTQLIITLLIIAVALGFAVYKSVKNLRNPIHKCEGCDLACAVRKLETLKKQAGR